MRGRRLMERLQVGINEIILINKFLCYDKKSMYKIDIVNLGLLKITDSISASNSLSCDFSSFTNPEQRFFLMSIINSIPAEWRSLIKASANVISANPLPTTPTIKLPSGNVVPILDISPKQIYQIFLQQQQIVPTAKQKLSNIDIAVKTQAILKRGQSGQNSCHFIS